MASLNLKDIVKKYPSGATALYNVSLEADDNEFLVIVGGEKCGKSTLLKVIAGVEEPDSGAVFIGGKDVTEEDAKERDVAMVFRGDALIPALNVYDNMAIGLRMRKAPEELIERRVKAAANILGLGDVLYRKPKVLPAATRQRVAFARAIVREPKLYLFDEPLAGIDENLRRDMLNVIINLQARVSGTFVYATKNLSEALTVGTRLVVLKNGLVQQIDSPSNLYDYPANTFVAFFIGSPTVNFLEKAKISKEEGGYAAYFAGGKLTVSENTIRRFSLIDEYAQSGKEVIIAIRPEDLCVAESGALSAEIIKCYEADGALYAECALGGGKTVTATVKDGNKKSGKVCLSPDLSKLYVFDGETRLTLLARDGGYADSGKKDAAFVPLPFGEEQRILENLKPVKEAQKKKSR